MKTHPLNTEVRVTAVVAWVAVLMLGMVAGWGQGTVNLANGAAGVNGPVTMPGTPGAAAVGPLVLVQGPEWRADLWLVEPGGALQWVVGPVGFAAPVPGYFLGGLVTIPGTAQGQSVTVVARVYNTNYTYQGFSQPVTVTLGGDKYPPENLVGLQSWTVQLLDTSLKIRVAGPQVTLAWSTNLVGFGLEWSPGLSPAQWVGVTNAPQASGSQWAVTLPVGTGEAYYRLRFAP